MNESEVTGWSDEGEAQEGYEPETVYEAHVNVNVSIHFIFSRRQGLKRVSVMRSDVSDGIWTNYTLGNTTGILYHVPLGTWILREHVGCQPDWLFRYKSTGDLRSPTVSKTWTGVDSAAQKVYREVRDRARGLKGKHYDAVIIDDMIKEVKGKMYLQLIDVIFFNRNTKEIDFRENVVAKDTDEAYLVAVQKYGKYDPRVHVKAARCLLGFAEKEEEEG